MATCVSFYNADGNLNVYSMIYSFLSLDSDWVSFKSATLLHYRQVLTKSHKLKKSFRQSSDQSSVVRKNQPFFKFFFLQKAIHL